MAKSGQVTLTDIAHRLNVSKVTVSKALRDHPDIGTETKRLVREMARELGYTPNFIARNLSAKSTQTLGLVVPKIAHHFFATAIEAIYSAASESNYEIIMTVSQERAENEVKHIETLLAMRVDGLLVSVTEHTKSTAIFEWVRDKGVPLVFFDRTINGLGFSTVTADDAGGAYLAVHHAIRQGYTKIAHVAGYAYTNVGRKRMAGYQRALREAGLEMRAEWVVKGGFGEQAGHEGFKQIHRSGNLPEIVFAVSYPVALGIYAGIFETNLSIPDDIDVISFGGSHENKFVSPAITCVDQPAEEIGRTATELLLQEIANAAERREQHLVLPTHLIVGDTCVGK